MKQLLKFNRPWSVMPSSDKHDGWSAMEVFSDRGAAKSGPGPNKGVVLLEGSKSH